MTHRRKKVSNTSFQKSKFHSFNLFLTKIPNTHACKKLRENENSLIFLSIVFLDCFKKLYFGRVQGIFLLLSKLSKLQKDGCTWDVACIFM